MVEPIRMYIDPGYYPQQLYSRLPALQYICDSLILYSPIPSDIAFVGGTSGSIAIRQFREMLDEGILRIVGKESYFEFLDRMRTSEHNEFDRKTQIEIGSFCKDVISRSTWNVPDEKSRGVRSLPNTFTDPIAEKVSLAFTASSAAVKYFKTALREDGGQFPKWMLADTHGRVVPLHSSLASIPAEERAAYLLPFAFLGDLRAMEVSDAHCLLTLKSKWLEWYQQAWDLISDPRGVSDLSNFPWLVRPEKADEAFYAMSELIHFVAAEDRVTPTTFRKEGGLELLWRSVHTLGMHSAWSTESLAAAFVNQQALFRKIVDETKVLGVQGPSRVWWVLRGPIKAALNVASVFDTTRVTGGATLAVGPAEWVFQWRKARKTKALGRKEGCWLALLASQRAVRQGAIGVRPAAINS